MKKLFFALLLAALVPTAANAQRLIGKELKSEDPSLKNDDRVYQYVMHTYVQGRDTLFAAFDLNGKRITPIEKDRPFYTGGGMFIVGTNKKDKNGHWICYGCSTEGEIVFSKSFCELMGCTWIQHMGEGLFCLYSYDDSNNRLGSLYDSKGESIAINMKTIILYNEDGMKYIHCENIKGEMSMYDMSFKLVFPKSYGYTFIAFYEKYGVWWCKNETTGLKHTYSKDLKYYADGQYDKYNMSEFNANKKSNPYYEGPYNFGNAYNSSTPNPPTPDPPKPNPPKQDPPKPNPPKPDPVPVQVWKPCVCQGGKCGVCDGLGMNKWAYMNNRIEPCMGCGWSGKCQFCGGQGGHYEVEYR